MTNHDQQANRRFEHYVYSIIEKYIDQADPAMQAQLIKLFGQLHDRLYPEIAHTPADPVMNSSRGKSWDQQAQLVQRLLIGYRGSIRDLTQQIKRIDGLIERVDRSSTPHREAILNHYHAIRKGWMVSLERTQLQIQHKLFEVVVDSM